MDSKLTLIIGAVVIWFLFFRGPTVPAYNTRPAVRPAPQQVPQQSSLGTFVNNAAPALGSFFGGLIKGYGSSSPATAPYGSASFGDDLFEPDYTDF